MHNKMSVFVILAEINVSTNLKPYFLSYLLFIAQVTPKHNFIGYVKMVQC